ncbi:YaaR family protein [Bacillus sp. SG-1]|uniref:YaaR family protein n=1 Tax=Bacillus sp. SG-1 TaxID=161544 RepID=UPI000154479C|nr:YaaR family protein [Bacillus sp. SG-1]EDL63778.1 YaaR [Bacillus sp. SG-1]
MKINQDLRVGVDKVRSEQKSNAGGSEKFSMLVGKQDQKLQMEQLGKLLGDITSAGERLGRSRTFKDLAKYKTLVKRFVKEAVDYGMNLKQSHTWNQHGEGRKLNIIENVDRKLIELTEDILNEEKQSIDILGKIGEVRGLLINLYT